MKPAVKKRWIKALRSGEYEQGHGRLHTADGKFCCLGVLADIEAMGDWVLEDRFNYVLQLDSGERGFATLPGRLAKRLGINGVQEDLFFRNDGCARHHPHTFDEIADWIEENL